MTFITHIIDSLCHHEVGHDSKHVFDDCGHSKVHGPEFSHQLSSSPCQPNMFHSLDNRPLFPYGKLP